MTNRAENVTGTNLSYLGDDGKYWISGGFIPEKERGSDVLHWRETKTLDEALDIVGDLSNWGENIVPGIFIFFKLFCIFDIEDLDSRQQLRQRLDFLNSACG